MGFSASSYNRSAVSIPSPNPRTPDDMDAERTATPEVVEETVATERRPLRYELPSVLAEQERQSRRLLLLVVRSVFFVLLVTVTVLTIASEKEAVIEFGWSTVF